MSSLYERLSGINYVLQNCLFTNMYDCMFVLILYLERNWWWCL